jgi:hypothetical protein
LTDWEDKLARAWVESLEEAYFLARGQARAALHGRQQSQFDKTGIHLFSRACGNASLIQHLLHLDPVLCRWTPTLIKIRAQQDAQEEYREEVLSGR